MPVPASAGSRILASQLQAQAGYKSGNQTVTSSTVLVNDSALVVPVAANSIYFFILECLYQGAATGTGDLKYGWSVPAGGALNARAISVTNPLGVAIGFVNAATVGFSASNGTSNPLALSIAGTVTTVGTSGSLQFKWAQNSSNATATTVLVGSCLMLFVA